MRFDDTLDTVLAADLTSPFGMQSAWRQLVDLIGRRRVPAEARAIATLRDIRDKVPAPVRAASARGLEFADPPAPLVRLLAIDELPIALPVLRSARLSSTEWIALLPELSPPARAVLRNRRDLSPAVRRALESFGPIDFVLRDESAPAEAPVAALPAEPETPAEVAPRAEARGEPVPALPNANEVIAALPAPEREETLSVDWTDVVDPDVLAEISALRGLVADAPEPVAASTAPSDSALVEDAIVSDAETAPIAADSHEAIAPSDFTDRPVDAPAAIGEAGDAVVQGSDAVGEQGMAIEAEAAVPLPPAPALSDLAARLFAAVAEQREIAAEADQAAGTAALAPESAFAFADAIEAPEAEARIASPETAADESPDAAAGEEEADFSFVALAEGATAVARAAGVTAGAAGAPAIAAQLAGNVTAPIQSGTDAGEARPAPVAQPVAASQGPAMDIDTLLMDPPESAAEAGSESPRDDEPAAFAGFGGGGDTAAESSQAFPEADGPHGEIEGTFQIADVVARIDAFWRKREADPEAAAAPRAPDRATGFRFETDSKGTIRWVDGVARAALVGLSLDLQGLSGTSRVDGIASGAFRRRAGFSNARLTIEGESDAAGSWLMSAIPVFDSVNGRFTGYRGTARRPRADERAEPVRPTANPADSLRQLVHELRTPTNAIAGFAEMIETQMLGPVSEPYRDRAGVIRAQAKELLGAIDDLDLAARIESAALALVPGPVQLRPLLATIADDLSQLADLRGSWIALPVDDLAVTGDRRAVERLLARLMATLVSASATGERIGVRTALDGDDMVVISLERPAALADFPGESMLGIDDEAGDATLLGTGFALRLARNLARELGGALVIDAESLTLRLPAAVTGPVEQAHLN